MKRFITLFVALTLLLSLSGCFLLEDSSTPCSECGSEDSFLYDIDHIGKEVLEEKIQVSYCESCYAKYLENTFGKGTIAQAQEKEEKFHDIVDSGGYLDAFN